jgi:hypothetical protein
MKKLACSLAVLGLLLAGTASAADPSPENGMGSATHQKREKKHRPKFAECDAGNKGHLTWDEAKTCFPRMSREKFDAVDANKDGGITREELKAYRAAHKKNRKVREQGMETTLNKS